MWQLPLIDEYRENLKSDVADMNNVGRARRAITRPLPEESSPARSLGPPRHRRPAFSEKDTPRPPRATGYAVRTILPT